MFAGQEQVPQPLGARQPLQLLQDRGPAVAMSVLDLLLIQVLDRRHMQSHESLQSVLQLDRLGLCAKSIALSFVSEVRKTIKAGSETAGRRLEGERRPGVCVKSLIIGRISVLTQDTSLAFPDAPDNGGAKPPARLT